jgi:hypothetical protein
MIIELPGLTKSLPLLLKPVPPPTIVSGVLELLEAAEHRSLL